MRTNTTLKTKLMSILLVAVLLLSMIPIGAFTVFAADDTISTNKTVMLGASQIEGAQASNVYFGTYKQSSDKNGGYNTDPIKWRVLSNSDDKLFLIADQNLDVVKFHTEREDVTWETSTLRSWLNGYDASYNIGETTGTDYSSNNFMDTAFSVGEKKVILYTFLENADNPSSVYNGIGGNDTTDQIFILSIAEATNTSYGFTNNDSRIAINTAYVADGGQIGSATMYDEGDPDYWWLRTPGQNNKKMMYVSSRGAAGYQGLNVNNVGTAVDGGAAASRPAFNLDLNSVLFTSAAVDGKPTDASGLDAVSDYMGDEYKLTLKDTSRNFSVTETSLEAAPGGTVNINYSGALTGDNEFVSAMIADSNNNILYYGHIAQNSASGIASIAIPADLEADSYTLKVFSEQYNGDYKTDYASEFMDIDLTVSKADPDLTITGGVEGTDYTYENGVLDIKAAGTYEIKNAEPATATTDAIRVSATSGEVIVKLGGVNIMPTDKSSFEIAGDCKTTVILKDGTENTLDNTTNAATSFAGLQNGEKVLTITCESSGNTAHECTTACGKLTATSRLGAGIGGGNGGNGTNITVSGGTVIATSQSGAGIGGGNEGNGSNITISGGTVTATSVNGAGIGSGNQSIDDSSNIKIAPVANTEITVNTGATATEAESLTLAFAKETDITALVSGNAYFHSETIEHIHTDANKDHVCDNNCAELIGTCADTDKDHTCDYGCGKTFGTHVAASGKHTCDYCGKAVTVCEDFAEVVKPEALKSAADCTDPAAYYKSCTVCGSLGTETFTSGEAKGHSFTDYKANGDATCTADGTKTAKCGNCEATDTVADTGSKKAHTYENGKCTVCQAVDPNYVPETSSPQTDDNSNMALWFALLFISGGTIITLTVYDRKRRSISKY